MQISSKAVVALALSLCIPVASTAQETAAKKSAQGDAKAAAKAADSKAGAEFDRVYGEWNELMAALADLQGKYQKASDDAKPAIEEQYKAEAARGEKLSVRLKAATEAAFAADPADKRVVQLMTAMAFTAWRDDSYEEADRLARLLMEQKINEPQTAWFAANAALALHKFDEVEPLVQKTLRGGDIGQKQREEAQNLVAAARIAAPLWVQEQKIRAAEAKADDLPRVKLETTKGDITIELFENEAPNTVASFVALVEKGFYDGIVFHRVLTGFMAQGGDPTGQGNGGPGYNIKDEYANPGARMHFRGTLSMANSGKPNTNGSQFFLTFKPTVPLNGRHTVFGRMIEGFEVLEKIQRIDPEKPTGATPDKIVKATVIRKRDHDYKPETIKQ